MVMNIVHANDLDYKMLAYSKTLPSFLQKEDCPVWIYVIVLVKAKVTTFFNFCYFKNELSHHASVYSNIL